MKSDFEALLKKTGKSHFRVAIFGSARIRRNDRNYKMIYKLAKLIGQENMDIVTGGGPGIMEAASKGHAAGSVKNDSYSVGLLIKLPKEQKANKHLEIKKEFSHFSERLDNFMILSDVVVVAPGGIGTLLEFVYAWQLVQVKHTRGIPIILMGKMWKDFIRWSVKWQLNNNFIGKQDLRPLAVANTCEEAFEIIKKVMV